MQIKNSVVIVEEEGWMEVEEDISGVNGNGKKTK